MELLFARPSRRRGPTSTMAGTRSYVSGTCMLLNQDFTAGLLEIRPVDSGCVVIRGVETERFLCIESDGTLYSSPTYIKDDCTFKEQILPDGYNIYVSDKHKVLLSLGNHRQRLQGRDRGVPALAQFLPRISTIDKSFSSGLNIPDQLEQSAVEIEEDPVDTMNSFGKLFKIIHSPSFHKR